MTLVLTACADLSGVDGTLPGIHPDDAPGTEASARGGAVRFRCGELDVDARFLDGGATVELVADDLDERLPRVAADDGEKYEQGVDDSYRLFWSKGDTARLAIGSDAWWACERVDPIGAEKP